MELKQKKVTVGRNPYKLRSIVQTLAKKKQQLLNYDDNNIKNLNKLNCSYYLCLNNNSNSMNPADRNKNKQNVCLHTNANTHNKLLKKSSLTRKIEDQPGRMMAIESRGRMRK